MLEAGAERYRQSRESGLVRAILAVSIMPTKGAFLMRGVDNLRAEFSLTALVYNLRRALNILGVETMMAAVRG